MRRINVTITAALVLFFYLSLTTVAAQPIVEELTIEPGEPTTLSTITFTAVITSEDDIGEVRLIIEECKVGLCYLSSNESMDMIEDTQEAFGGYFLNKDSINYYRLGLLARSMFPTHRKSFLVVDQERDSERFVAVLRFDWCHPFPTNR